MSEKDKKDTYCLQKFHVFMMFNEGINCKYIEWHLS